VPADRILYALRDVTATVEDDGLIAASIMAKKVATGTSALALDIKVGRGAFLHDLEHARDLARRCRLIGEAYGRRVACLYTAMDAPMGMTVGNRIEVEEAWRVLEGDGPEDVRTVALELAAVLLAASDLGLDEAEARRRATAALDEGRAAEAFERWCYVQGGRWKPGEFHRLAEEQVKAERSGTVSAIDALAVGQAAQLSGAGRQTVDDDVDPAAGVVLACRVGDEVGSGDLLGTVYARDRRRREAAGARLGEAFALADGPVERPAVILGRD
jgi:pyrimidine-nucleoside phosphorylase